MCRNSPKSPKPSQQITKNKERRSFIQSSGHFFCKPLRFCALLPDWLVLLGGFRLQIDSAHPGFHRMLSGKTRFARFHVRSTLPYATTRCLDYFIGSLLPHTDNSANSADCASFISIHGNTRPRDSECNRTTATMAYRLQTPKSRPGQLHLEESSYKSTSSFITRPESPPFLYDVPSSPKSTRSLISPTSPTFPPTTPPSASRNRSATPAAVAQSDLEQFAQYCRAWSAPY